MKFAFLALHSLLALVAATADDSCHSEDCTMSGPSMVQMSRAHSKKTDEKVVSALVRYLNSQGEQSGLEADVGGHPLNLRHLHTEAVMLNETAMARLMADPNVIVEENNHVVHPAVHHRGKAFSLEGRAESTPFGIDMVRSAEIPEGSHRIKICVIDTGYDSPHEDLPQSNSQPDIGFFSGYTDHTQWPYNAHNNEGGDADTNGHGTHCAGTIGAVGGNNKGVTSVNPNPGKFTFKIAKGLVYYGQPRWGGTSAGILAGVNWCVDQGAKVISMSLGGGPFSQIEQDAYDDAWNNGALVIAAAGNGGNAVHNYPASYKHVVSVAAVDSNRNKAGFSQWNDRVGIAAPGVGIVSTYPGNLYATMDGTSMATPHVAGVAAKLWSNFPDCTNKQIRNVLFATADGAFHAGHGCNHELGFGIMDGARAYQLLQTKGCEAGDFGVHSEPDAICDAIGALPKCAESGCSRSFHLYLKTDRFPYETTWSLANGAGVLAAQGGYGGQHQEYHEHFHCLDGSQHTFTIYDSWGDGICCGYGAGWYRVEVGGVVIKEGGDFPSSETTVIPAASVARVEITSDRYGGETTWDLVNSLGNSVLSGGPYLNERFYQHDYSCVDAGDYAFTIRDSYGDGICCGYGHGSYQVTVRGATQSGGSFGQRDTKNFFSSFRFAVGLRANPSCPSGHTFITDLNACKAAGNTFGAVDCTDYQGGHHGATGEVGCTINENNNCLHFNVDNLGSHIPNPIFHMNKYVCTLSSRFATASLASPSCPSGYNFVTDLNDCRAAGIHFGAVDCTDYQGGHHGSTGTVGCLINQNNNCLHFNVDNLGSHIPNSVPPSTKYVCTE